MKTYMLVVDQKYVILHLGQPHTYELTANKDEASCFNSHSEAIYLITLYGLPKTAWVHEETVN